jgi:hypothetical protein
MSVETLERPAGQVAESVDDTEIDMDEINAFFDEYINSGVPKIYEATVNEKGHIVIPDDFPEELMEAWDGENVRKI